jgi:hypothetical protein
MRKKAKTSHWERALADARSIDPGDFWERAKLLSGITGLAMIDQITEEQAEYARKLFSERDDDSLEIGVDLSDQKYRNELWTRVVLEAKSAVERDDGWDRLKLMVGLAQLFGFGMISQEQVDHVRGLLLGEDESLS